MRHRFWSFYFLIIILALSISSIGRAQSSPDSCERTHVYASVLNNHKQVVGGLLAENFSAQVDGKPVVVKDVQHDVTKHRVVILIDHSTSMLEIWPAVADASMGTVKQLPNQVPLSVIFFDEEIRELIPFTKDRQAALKLLDQFLEAICPNP